MSQQVDNIKRSRQVRIGSEWHKKLRVLAAYRGTTIKNLIEEYVEDGLMASGFESHTKLPQIHYK